MTEMIRELMIQSVGHFWRFLVFPCWSICRGNIWFMRALPEVPDGWRTWYRCRWNLAGGGGIFSSLAAALLSQVFARVLKAPVTIFLVAGILPTVPGASIYRSVYFLIQGQTKWYNFYLIQTIQIAGAMAVAIFIVDSLFRLLRNKAS